MTDSTSLKDFNKLNKDEQYELVFTKWDFVNYYLKGEISYALYSLNKFFVEVEYNIPKNKIINLIAFEEATSWIVTG